MPITTSNGVSLIVVITLELAPLIKSVSPVKEDCGPSSAKKKRSEPKVQSDTTSPDVIIVSGTVL